MKYQKFEYYFSKARVKRYKDASGQNKKATLVLYRENICVSQSFFPILNIFETVLRNQIDVKLSHYFDNENWIIHERNGFMSNHSIRFTNFFLKTSVEKSIAKLRSESKGITNGRVIAKQTFGFWVSLFDKHHYRLIGGSLINIFPNKPREISRKEIREKLRNIGSFRNRLYHNEPICFSGDKIDFSEALSIKKEIFTLLEWMDSDLIKFSEPFNNIDNKIKKLQDKYMS